MIICVCHHITEKTVLNAVDNGAVTFAELVQATGVGTCCGACTDCAMRALDNALSQTQPCAA